MKFKKNVRAFASFMVSLFVFGLGGVQGQEPKDIRQIDAKNFDNPTDIDNPWYPMKPGMRFVWEGTSVDDEGEEESHRVIFTVTDLTKKIGGIETVVCWDQDIVDGEELVESEIVFFAQDNDGAIWSLGEYPEEYEDDEFVEAPCWIHGFRRAKAGILIPANPSVGTPRFSQGWAPAVDFTDFGIVEKVGQQKMTVPFGTYNNILVIDEWNLDEIDRALDGKERSPFGQRDRATFARYEQCCSHSGAGTDVPRLTRRIDADTSPDGLLPRVGT